MLIIRQFSKLAGEPLQTALKSVPSWTLDDARPSIKKSFAFKDFKSAWKFMNLVANVADQNDHHPEWFNVYNRVEVTLTTHDASGITMKDVDLASYMDEAESLVKKEDGQ